MSQSGVGRVLHHDREREGRERPVSPTRCGRITYDGDPPLMLLMLASFTQANSRLSRAWLPFEQSAPTVATELCSSRATEQQFLSLSQHALGSRYSLRQVYLICAWRGIL